jgi:hypothetical protein
MGTMRGFGRACLDTLRDLFRAATWVHIGRGFLSLDGAVVVIAAFASAYLGGWAQQTPLFGLPVWLLVTVGSMPCYARLFAVIAGRVALQRYPGLTQRRAPTLWEVTLLTFFPLVPLSLAFVAVVFIEPRALGPVLFLLAVVVMERPLFRLATLLVLSRDEADALVTARRWRSRTLPADIPVAGLTASGLLLVSWLTIIVATHILAASVLPESSAYTGGVEAIVVLFDGLATGLLLSHFYLARVQALVQLPPESAPMPRVMAGSAKPVADRGASVHGPAGPKRWTVLRDCPPSMLFLCVVLLAWGAALVYTEYGVIVLSGRFGVFHAELHRLATQLPGLAAWPLLFSACGLLLAAGLGWARWVFAIAVAVHLVLVHQQLPLLAVLAVTYAASFALLFGSSARMHFAPASRLG